MGVSRIATEAGQIAVTYGFETLGIERLVGIVHPENKASQHVLEKIGMQFVEAFGGSNWTLSRVLEAEAYAEQHGMIGFAGVSNNLSLAVQAEPFYSGLISCDDAEAQWHLETGKPLFAWSSLARGFFTGAYGVELRDQPEWITDGFLKRMGEVYCTDGNFERLARAEKLAKQKGEYTAVQVALSWLIHHPVQVIPIVVRGHRQNWSLVSMRRQLI